MKRSYNMNPHPLLSEKYFSGTHPKLTVRERQIMSMAVIYAAGQYYERGYDRLPDAKNTTQNRKSIENKLIQSIETVEMLSQDASDLHTLLKATNDMPLSQKEAMAEIRAIIKAETIGTLGDFYRKVSKQMNDIVLDIIEEKTKPILFK